MELGLVGQTKTVVLIPCYNEEKTIAKVIRRMKRALPEAQIYVFDNNCTDRTANIAQEEGAIVLKEMRQGKGFVIASMFGKVVADYYVMIDGDDTYQAEFATEMVEMLKRGEADVVVASRMSSYEKTKTRRFHKFGNSLVSFAISRIYGTTVRDPMSGFRALTYDAVAVLPFLSTGFEIETEMTIQSLFRNLNLKEIEVPYGDRPAGSHSKLNTFADGFMVLVKILMLFMAYKPMTFFGALGLLSCAAGLAAGGGVILPLLQGGLVTRPALLVLCIVLVLAGLISGVTGVIIHTINYRILESSTLTLRQIRNAPKIDG